MVRLVFLIICLSVFFKAIMDETGEQYNQIPLRTIDSSPTKEEIDYQTFFKIYQHSFYEEPLHKILFTEPEFYDVFNKQLQELFAS